MSKIINGKNSNNVMTNERISQNHNIVNIRTTILTRKIQLDIFVHTQLNND